MKYIIHPLVAIGLTFSSLGGQLAEMDNEALARAFNGWSIPDYSEAKLKSELESSDASALIRKCMDDERLRKALPVFPKYMIDGEARDKLICDILEEPGVWYSDEPERNTIDKRSEFQVMGFVNETLRKEFFLEPDDVDLPKLSKAIFRKSTRYLVADLFERLSNIEKSKRHKDSPEMVALVEELRQTLTRLEMAETGEHPLRPLPRRDIEDDQGGLKPRDGSGNGQTAATAPVDIGATEQEAPKRLIFFAVAVVLVMLGGTILFRFRLPK